jgi:hypothetical protein
MENIKNFSDSASPQKANNRQDQLIRTLSSKELQEKKLRSGEVNEMQIKQRFDRLCEILELY